MSDGINDAHKGGPMLNREGDYVRRETVRPSWKDEIDQLKADLARSEEERRLALGEIERLKIDLKIAQARDVDHVSQAQLQAAHAQIQRLTKPVTDEECRQVMGEDRFECKYFANALLASRAREGQ